MPLREFGCLNGHVTEKFFHTTHLEETPRFVGCERCDEIAKLMFSLPNVDTADVFKPFSYKGPDGRHWEISNLHSLRAVEKAYQGTYDVRFDAYSADPSNHSDIDGNGQPFWDGDKSHAATSVATSLPIRED